MNQVASTDRYCILGPQGTRNTIELWSEQRLPFQPTGWLMEMRNTLRNHLSLLRGRPKTILQATFFANDQDVYDTENVLFYNVGQGSFRDFCRTGLSFKRIFNSPPPAPISRNPSFSCYHKYELVDEDPSQSSPSGKVLAKWSQAECLPLKGEIKPHSIWSVMRSHPVELFVAPQSPLPFAIDITIEAPSGTVVNLSSVVKPLLDGIIASFHVHDGSDVNIVVPRLASKLHRPTAHVEKMLGTSVSAIFGPRRLIWVRSSSIQWNPADDMCVSASIHLKEKRHGNNWTLSGWISSAENTLRLQRVFLLADNRVLSLTHPVS